MSEAMECPICKGTGIETLRLLPDGSEQRTTCVACGGDGELPTWEEDLFDAD